MKQEELAGHVAKRVNQEKTGAKITKSVSAIMNVDTLV